MPRAFWEPLRDDEKPEPGAAPVPAPPVAEWSPSRSICPYCGGNVARKSAYDGAFKPYAGLIYELADRGLAPDEIADRINFQIARMTREYFARVLSPRMVRYILKRGKGPP